MQGKGKKNGHVLTPPLISSTPIKHPPPQTQSHVQQKGPTVFKRLSVSKKTGLQVFFSQVFTGFTGNQK